LAWLVLVLAIAVVVVSILLVQELTEPDSPTPTRVTVPILVGRTLGDARAIADTIGLRLVPTGQVSHQPVSTVLDQDPASGTLVDRGATIAITVATADDLVIVPELLGTTEAEALRLLSDVGLVAGTRSEAPAALVVAGSIASQDPAAGTRAPRGTPVSYVVSTGTAASPSGGPTPARSSPPESRPPALGPIVVGDYRCLTLPDATEEIRADGLKLGRVSYSIEGGAVNDTWIVDRQSPAPGERRPRDTAVDLLLASPFNTCV
jgi:hypothetical protein